MRGSATSSANLVTPRTLAVASTLRWAVPTTRNAGVVRLRPPIQRLPGGLGGLAAQPRRGELHRFVDLDVAGAAAEVARERRLDLLAGRPRIPDEERFGREEERRGAVAALRRAELRERFLQRMQRAALG